jgi:hypothetical protein
MPEYFLKAMISDVTVMASAELQLEANTPHQWLLVSLPMGSSFVNDWVG